MKKIIPRRLGFLLLLALLLLNTNSIAQKAPEMLFGDTSRVGVPFSKDPHVVSFQNRYLMYYSIPPSKNPTSSIEGWGIGIAASTDLVKWQRVGEITPGGEYENKGLAAPSAIVVGNRVHLFYQTYGNWAKDAICHAFSDDGLHFKRNETNPIFHPTGLWTAGRAIDAEIWKQDDKFLLYFATRDSAMKIQYVGVASAPINTDFSRSDWTQLTNAPIVKPEFPWEETCVEGPSIIRRGNWLYMFYAGAYNNRPQQIGVARSKDGITWESFPTNRFWKTETRVRGITANQVIRIFSGIRTIKPSSFTRETMTGVKRGTSRKWRCFGMSRGHIWTKSDRSGVTGLTCPKEYQTGAVCKK